MSIKQASDELSRMMKLYRSFEEAQTIIDALSSSEQKAKELASTIEASEKTIASLTAQKVHLEASIDKAEKQAALEAAQELAKVEEAKAEATSLANSIVASAKEEAQEIVKAAKEKTKAEGEKLAAMEKKVAVASQELADKEDALAQVQNSINKLLGK
jgi:chromosome segregation ATPase